MDQDPFSTVVLRGKWTSIFHGGGLYFTLENGPGGPFTTGVHLQSHNGYFSLKIDSCLIQRVFGTMFGVIRLLLLRHQWQGWVGWEIVIDVKRKALRVAESFIETFGALRTTRSAGCLGRCGTYRDTTA